MAVLIAGLDYLIGCAYCKLKLASHVSLYMIVLKARELFISLQVHVYIENVLDWLEQSCCPPLSIATNCHRCWICQYIIRLED